MNREVRTLIVLVVALAAAGLASFAVHRAVQRMPVKEVEIATQQVVVAAKALPVGSLIGPGDVRLIAWPIKSPVAGALVKIEDVVGRGLLNPVVENEPLTESKLAPRGAGAGLPPTIPTGMRAISVKVDEVVAVAGFTVPGTRVDVLGPSPTSRTRGPDHRQQPGGPHGGHALRPAGGQGRQADPEHGRHAAGVARGCREDCPRRHGRPAHPRAAEPLDSAPTVTLGGEPGRPDRAARAAANRREGVREPEDREGALRLRRPSLHG